MRLSISAVERDVARQQGRIDRFRRKMSRFAEGTPEHKSAVGRLRVAECFLIADTKLLAWMKRRLALFRALNAERFMEAPEVID
jgi:transposase